MTQSNEPHIYPNSHIDGEKLRLHAGFSKTKLAIVLKVFGIQHIQAYCKKSQQHPRHGVTAQQTFPGFAKKESLAPKSIQQMQLFLIARAGRSFPSHIG